MNDEGTSSISENRVLAFGIGDGGSDNSYLGGAVRANQEVRHIAGMGASRIIRTVFFPIRVEMTARRGELRRIAFSGLMNVDGMLAGRQVREIEYGLYAAGLCFGEESRANVLTLRVFHLHSSLRGKAESDRQQAKEPSAKVWHYSSYLYKDRTFRDSGERQGWHSLPNNGVCVA